MKIRFWVNYNVIKLIAIGFVLGCFLTLIYLAFSDTLRYGVQKKIERDFLQSYGCKLLCHLDNIDWLSLTMHFSEVKIIPYDDTDQWSIESEKLTVKGSWLKLLSEGYLRLSMNFEHMIMHEQFDQAPYGLGNFFKKLFSDDTPGCLVYDGASMTDGLLYLKRSFDDLNIKAPYVCNLHREDRGAKMQLYINDGSAWYKGNTFLDKIAGSIILSSPTLSDFLYQMNGQMQFDYMVNIADHQDTGFCSGKIEKGVGKFALKSSSGILSFDPVLIQFDKSHCDADLMVSASAKLLEYFDFPDMTSDFGGQLGIHVKGDLFDFYRTMQISADIQDLMYKSQKIVPGGKIVLKQHQADRFSGTLVLKDQEMFDVKFAMKGVRKKINIQNVIDLSIDLGGVWKIEKNKCSIEVEYEDIDRLEGKFEFELDEIALSEHKRLAGTFSVHEGKLRIVGAFQDIAYEFCCSLFPEFIFEKFEGRKKDNIVFNFVPNRKNHRKIQGKIDFSIIQNLVSDELKNSFAQKGEIFVQGIFKDDFCELSLKTQQAHIRIPYLYNVVQSASATCEIRFLEKNIVFKNIDIELYEGKISCSRATIFFDKNFNCCFVHIPLLLHKVMTSWNKGVYSLITGRILFSKDLHKDAFGLEGKLMLQKSELKENIFSAQFQELLSGMQNSIPLQEQNKFDCVYDISIFTQDPLQIETSFLSAQAIVDLLIQGNLKKTELSGVIQFLSGSFKFPYKSLDITQGKLLFLPEQPFDPIIELIAWGKLKRFNVGMHAWGSALQPNVQFEARPYLSEEQIMTLLLLGIENSSLGMMVPAFLTQRLKDIIFGPALSKTKLKSVFDRLLKSLRYFRFLPQFTNQTGRGGLRGIFEVDATEHLHGKIDTNFMQLEDTKFDVDYTLTDDITLRAQKDGPSTYGGEVEFCWRFN